MYIVHIFVYTIASVGRGLLFSTFTWSVQLLVLEFRPSYFLPYIRQVEILLKKRIQLDHTQFSRDGNGDDADSKYIPNNYVNLLPNLRWAFSYQIPLTTGHAYIPFLPVSNLKMA